MFPVRKLAVAAALLAAGGCGPGDPNPAPPPQLVFGLAARDAGPWDEALSLAGVARRLDPGARRRPGSQALDLDFRSGALPEAWSFLRASTPPRIVDGVLELELGDGGKKTDVVWRVDAEADAITHLGLRVGEVPSVGSGSELRVTWKGSAKPRFSDQRPVVVPYQEVHDGLLVVPLVDNPAWTGRIEALRFNLGARGRFQIQSIQGFHLADLLRVDDSDPSAFDHRVAELGRMRRPALRVAPTSWLRERVAVAPGEALVLGIGLHPLSSRLSSSATRFEVTAQENGEALVLERITVRAAGAEAVGGWQDLTVDLSRFAGRELTLGLRTSPAGDGVPTGIPLWAEPRIRAAARTDAGPNLLLISVDTLRADHLESYGYGATTSPTISRLAREGALFREAIAHAPSTLPSHGSLFTGIPALKNRLNGATGLRLPESRLTLAEILRDHGFVTAGIAGGAYLDPYFGLSQGFDTYAYAKSQNHLTGFDYSDIEANTLLALRWLEQNRDRRFFLFFHTYEVHSPYDPRTPWVRDYLPAEAETPEWRVVLSANNRGVPLEPPAYAGWREHIRFRDRGERFTDSDLERLLATYDSEIRVADLHLGRLIDALDGWKLLDETVVILTSDHGEAFLEHGRTEHGHLYAENLHVPLILRHPPVVPAGTVVEERVQLVDVVPTALDLLGVAIPPDVEGLSLLPRLVDGRPLPARAAISYNTVSGISYIAPDGRKLIANVLPRHPLAGRVELFDLDADPAEEHDLVATLDAAGTAALFAEVDAALADLPGSHLRIRPDRPLRFSGTLALEGSHATLRQQLRSFPLRRGWVRFDPGELSARIETGWLDHWWLHTDTGAGRLTLRGEFRDEDGASVPVDETFAIENLPRKPAPSAVREREAGALRIAIESFAVDPAAGEKAHGSAPSGETLRQLQDLGYIE